MKPKKKSAKTKVSAASPSRPATKRSTPVIKEANTPADPSPGNRKTAARKRTTKPKIQPTLESKIEIPKAAEAAPGKRETRAASPRQRSVAGKPAPKKAARVGRKSIGSQPRPEQTGSSRSSVESTSAPAPASPAKEKKAPDAPVAEPVRPTFKETATGSPAPASTPKSTTPASSVSVVPKRPARKVPEQVPSILLEGDEPSTPIHSGPGQRYALSSRSTPGTEPELPVSYGTRRLLVAARDPHWLYVHWDLTDEQLRHYNAASLDQHLILRIHADSLQEKAEQEVHLAAEARHWFAHVRRAGTRYVAELGYYAKSGRWTSVATSSATMTPPDSMAEDTSAEFATLPFEVPMSKLLTLVQEAVEENPPLAKALQTVRAEERPDLPSFPKPPGERRRSERKGKSSPEDSRPHPAAPPWTAEQEKALSEIISMDHVRRVWMGSMEITELIRRQVVQELAEAAAAQLGQPGSAPTSPAGERGAAAPGGEAITSPTRQQEKEGRGFWFNINAELIIYGATEADANVTIAGRRIRLRPDGTFSYRFALPDGQFELPVVAVSKDQTDGRAAELAFARRTEYRGHVGKHPQDPSLKVPSPEAV